MADVDSMQLRAGDMHPVGHEVVTAVTDEAAGGPTAPLTGVALEALMAPIVAADNAMADAVADAVTAAITEYAAGGDVMRVRQVARSAAGTALTRKVQ